MPLNLLLLVLVLLAGCPGKGDDSVGGTDPTESSPPTDDSTVPLRDQDGDGQYEDIDCNDLDADVYVGADESCDDKDNDCDREIDEGLEVFTWYLDADSDGWGDPAATLEDCIQPDGYVLAAGDCDDGDGRYHPSAEESDCADPADYNCDGSVGYADGDGDGWPACRECDDAEIAVNPDAAELCDHVDNDCDGDIDTDALDAATWFTDLDGDGYGDDASKVIACDQPEGTVPYGGDCDDADAAYNPGVIEGDCTDPADYNCDGSTGYADADADGFAACDPAECDDHDPAANGAADERCDELDNDCDALIDEADAVDAPVWYADADGDGYGDGAFTLTACVQPYGFVADASDCDDADPGTNPGVVEACDDPVDHNCDGSVGYEDADLDGYAACAECDDGNTFVNPGAVEVCNARDDNCDGVVDTDAADRTVWYYDGDGDGYGNPTMSVTQCIRPTGFVSTGGDCDDGDTRYNPGAAEADCTDPNDYNCDGSTGFADTDGDGVAACLDCDDADAEAFPGGTEVCDGEDNDCDGAADESAVDATGWYADADGDGYGDTSVVTTACTQPAGTAAVGGDCDDGDASFNPGAAEPDCTDPADYNCDGSTGYADLDGDGYAACDPAECNDRNAAVHDGATEYCNGIDDNCNGVTDGDASVDRPTWYADADGDGYGDSTRTLLACTRPTGYATVAGDCNDGSARYNPGAAETDCTDPNDYNCDGLTGYVDADGDSYAACEDCDDGDADVHPGAVEYCNGYDDNCNGTVDGSTSADRSTWYGDADADGYGSVKVTTLACTQPSGYVANADDCNDGDRTAYPSASEYCDGVDDDCDGTPDDGAVDAATWYRDGDADSYGGTTSTRACSVPSGYVATSTDCDDALASVNPGATESCNSRDDDCDGATDEAGATGEGTWYRDADTDGYGDATVSTRACATPSGYVGDATDCDDSDGTTWPGADELCGDGVDNSCDGVVDEACPWAGAHPVGDAELAFAGAQAGDRLGAALAGGDLDGDGAADLVVAAPGWDPTGTGLGEGRVYVWRGALGAETLAGADSVLDGDADGDAFGSAAAAVGDVDGDGEGDLLVGAPGWSGTAAGAGAAYLFGGAIPASGGAGDAVATIEGAGADERVGGAVVGGIDEGDDGEADLGIGAPGAGAAGGGGVAVFAGPVAGTLDFELDALAVYTAGTVGEEAGAAIAVADLDGDGAEDLLVGAPGADGTGTARGGVYLLLGPHAGAGSLDDADGFVSGAADDDAFGAALASLGDLDGDGYAELAVGAPGVDTEAADAGAAFVFYGSAAVTALATATEADATRTGPEAGDAAGAAVGGGADVDADGVEDLLVGGPGHDAGADGDAGVAWLLYGPFAGVASLADADAAFAGATTGDAVGAAVGTLGDTDGDGAAEFVTGSGAADASSLADAGGAWIFFGAGL